MPNRIIKESICTSDNLDNLSPQEEVFFYRLMVNCDDYGRFYAKPSILRAKCFPLRLDKITDELILQWLLSLVNNKLIFLYESDTQKYILLTTWSKHQQIRAKRSKFPEPNGNPLTIQSSASICNHMISLASDSKCNQPQANVPVIQSNPIRNPIQSNPPEGDENSSPVSGELTDLVTKLDDKTATIDLEKGQRIKEVFSRLDKLRGYRPPKRNAEAASIMRMLKLYTPDEIIDTWEALKKDKFYQDKEIFMMTVETQIGARLHKEITKVTKRYQPIKGGEEIG